MLIRNYKKDDYPAIEKLWNETGIADENRKDSAESVEKCLETGGCFLVMEDEKTGTIIGTSWITFDGRRMYLHHFCIKPSYQGLGYGNELTEASLAYLKDMGYQVKLEVHADNVAAIKLYEKYGFFRFKDYNIYMIRDIEGIPDRKS